MISKRATARAPLAPPDTATTMRTHIGRVGTYRLGQMLFEVSVLDVRSRWGTLDFLITPSAGHGNQWVQADKVQLEDVNG